MTGWNFSEFGDGYIEQQPPWSYGALAREALSGASSALDLGTGGGEVLLQLRDALPPDTVATEGWAPNIPVASSNLSPHGIAVVRYDADTDARLPPGVRLAYDGLVFVVPDDVPDERAVGR